MYRFIKLCPRGEVILQATGAIMNINYLSEISEHPLRADESAMGAINRPLQPFHCRLC